MSWQKAVLGRASLSRTKTSQGCVPSFASSEGGATPILLEIRRWLQGGRGCICFGKRGFIYFFFWENTFWPRKNERNDNLSWSSLATKRNIQCLYVVTLPAAGMQRQCRKEEINVCHPENDSVESQYFDFTYKIVITGFGPTFAPRHWDVAGILLEQTALWDLTPWIPLQIEMVGQLADFPAGLWNFPF